MTTITEDLEVWAELGNDEAVRAFSFKDIQNDMLEQGYIVDTLDECAGEYIGTLSVVMAGPDIILLDEKSEPVYQGMFQVSGTFNGAAVLANPDYGIDIGCHLNTITVTSPEAGMEEALKGAEFAIGLLSTTNMWAPDDIFNGCASITIPEQEDAVLGPERARLADVEEDLDIALLNGPLDMDSIQSILKDKARVRDGLELSYFLRRVNVLMQPGDLRFSLTASQMYKRGLEDETFTALLEPGTEVSIVMHPGSHLTVLEGDGEYRMVCLVARQADERGACDGLVAVDIDDVSEMSAQRL